MKDSRVCNVPLAETPVTLTLCCELFSQCHIDPRGNERELSTRKRLFQFSIYRLGSDGNLGDPVLRE
jgi:hypothetical protein